MGGEVVLLALEEVVVPLEDDVVLVVFGGRGTEVDGADVAAAAGVAADRDEQVLAGAGSVISGVRLEAEVVAQRAALKDVVPGGDGERGNLDVLEVFFDGPLLPVAVVFSVGGPVEEIWGESLGEFCARTRLGNVEDGKLRERQNVDARRGRWCRGGWRG